MLVSTLNHKIVFSYLYVTLTKLCNIKYDCPVDHEISLEKKQPRREKSRYLRNGIKHHHRIWHRDPELVPQAHPAVETNRPFQLYL